MKLKIALVIIGFIIIFSLILFGAGIKEKALKGIFSNIADYNCGKSGICTSCIIDGYQCNCGKDMCSCGNKTINKAECELYKAD